ncbi:MAG: PAS domain S-box protein [Spirochaeta sp.]|jgi:PAS domain S-box-containing protein|nr:PAS domain S-box protein [Spirochaeta sp.]
MKQENGSGETSSETTGFRSIGTKLVRYFALFALVFVVLVTVVQLLMEYSREKDHIREHLAYVETGYGAIIAGNAYLPDPQALDMTLEAILRSQGIEFVEVRERSADGEESLAEAGNPDTSSDMVKVFTLPEGIIVEVRASTSNLVALLWSRAYVFLLVGLLIAVAFASGVLAIVHRYLVIPVVKLAGFARTLEVESAGESGALDLPRGRFHRRRDELDVLREAFEDLQTRLKREMTERDEANALYRALFENTHVAMLAINPEDGRIIRANGAAEKFYGWTRDELSAMSIQEINTLPPDEVQRKMESARMSGQGYFEFRHRVSDGSVRDVAVHSGTAAVDSEAVLHSVIVDISAQKAAERERDLTAFGMDRSGLGVMRIREDDAVVESANTTACSLLGYSPAELIGMQVYHFDASMDPKSWVQHRRGVRQKRQYQFETIHRRRDGTEYPAEVTVAYIEYGGQEYSFSFFQDITGRKEAEDRLVGLLREKEVLLREVHHRVRNNLLVMSSLINLQTARIHSVMEAQNAVEKIRDRIRAMSLAYSAVDDSNDLSKINLAYYSEGLAVYLQDEYALDTPVAVTVDPSEVRADLTKAIPFGLILNELVTNSLKHAFTGTEEGRVSISFSPQDGAMVEAVVADTGAGIPESILQAKEKPLGLMLIDRLTDQLGGTVSYDVRHGTRVSVTFRVSDIEVGSDE